MNPVPELQGSAPPGAPPFLIHRPSSARPVIIIPARFSSGAAALRYRAEVTAEKLVQAVCAAGAEPVVLHPEVPEGCDEQSLDELVRARIWMADGVLLPGGGDLAPHWAGQGAHATEYDVDDAQDAFDLSLARVALEDRIPLLAICRGTQVVNVALGGDLIQDLSETLGRDHRDLMHTIQIVDGSLLRQFLPGDHLTISCYHHQALGRLGDGLRASAYAADGTIEAVALDGHDGWYLGVQWHPEDTAAGDPEQARLFHALSVAAASRSAGVRSAR